MKRITKEYIEFFNYCEDLERVLDNFFDSLRASIPKEDYDYFCKLRTSFDISSLVEKTGASLEEVFTQSEMEEIMQLYTKHPVLVKMLKTKERLSSEQQIFARDMVEDAARRMPFLVEDGQC